MKHKASNRMLFRRTSCAVLLILTLLRGSASPHLARAGPGGTVTIQATTWTIQSTPITNGWLTDVYFVDENTGWAVGYDDASDQAAIIHTTNGGEEWVAQPNPMAGELNAVFFVDEDTGYAAGQDSGSWIALLKTTNGGEQWQEQTLPTIYSVLDDVLFVSATEGWAVGTGWTGDAWETLILHTKDGTTWVESSHPVHDGRLGALSFADPDHGWAVGVDDDSGTPIILHTNDGGENWVEQAHPIISGALVDVFFYSADMGWAVGRADTAAAILETTDGGTTWTALSPPQASMKTGVLSKAKQRKISVNPAIFEGNQITSIDLFDENDRPPVLAAALNRAKNSNVSTTLWLLTRENRGEIWTKGVEPPDHALIRSITVALGNNLVRSQSPASFIVYGVGWLDSGPFMGRATVQVTPPEIKIYLPLVLK